MKRIRNLFQRYPELKLWLALTPNYILAIMAIILALKRLLT